MRFRCPVRYLMVLCWFLVTLTILAGCARGKRRFTSHDGVRIACKISGHGDPAIVFVHGWCCDRTFWKHQESCFADRCTVVTLDLAGHGESGMNRTAWTVESFAGDVQTVVEGLGLTRVVLVGHSMGGPVVLEAARRMPGRVIGIVGADVFHRFGCSHSREFIVESFKPLRSNFPVVMREVAAAMFSPRADSSLVREVSGFMARADSAIALETALNYFFWQIDHYAEAAGAVGAPICAIVGEDSPDMWDLDGEGNRRIHPRFEAKILPGAGHFVMIESPERFNRYLDECVTAFSKWNPGALRESGHSPRPAAWGMPSGPDDDPGEVFDEEE